MTKAIPSMSTHSASRRLAVITVLGFSSGLPLALTASTLQAWLTIDGVDVATIGLFSLIGLPYVFKFLWAPVLDRFDFGPLGRRRTWMLAMQVLIVGFVLVLATLNPATEIVLFTSLALCIAFVSATQDIAVDAYRAETLAPLERGMGAGLSVMGYRIAMIVSGAGALMMADRVGFPPTYAAVALVALLGPLAVFMGREPPRPARPPTNLSAAVVRPFVAFFTRRHAIWILLLIVVYKLGDAFAASLTTVFLVRGVEFSLTDVGAINKGLGVLATIGGGLFGGALMMRWGLFRSLFVFGILQAVTNLGFMSLAIVGKSYSLLIAIVALENVSGGMGTAALVALLMALCDKRYTATQFALLSAAASLGRIFSGPPAGYLVEAIGWAEFFLVSVLLAIPGLVVVWLLRGVIKALD
jgi:PAT family beta-lactamase induction signal transducer AmpG